MDKAQIMFILYHLTDLNGPVDSPAQFYDEWAEIYDDFEGFVEEDRVEKML